MGKNHLKLEQVKHIAALAQLELNPHEEEALLGSLNQILTYFEQIDGVDTKQISPMSHSLVLETPFAKDEVGSCLGLEEALANAPDRQEGQVRVPAVLEE